MDQRADIFSLGAVLYEMLCHERPAGAFVPPSTRTGCDPRWDAIIKRAMQADPARRYTSTTEIRAALDEMRTTACPTPVPAAASPAAKPQRWLLMMIGALAALLMGSLLHWQKLRPEPPRLPLTGNVTEPQSYPSPKRWVDDMPRVSETARVFKCGEMRDGRLHITRSSGLTLADGLQLADTAVRVVGRGRVTISLRGTHSQGQAYHGTLEETGLAGITVGDARGRIPPRLPADPIVLAPDFDPNQDHETVFAVKGDVLSLWVDRVLITSVRDHTLRHGALAISCWGAKAGTPAAQNFKSIEYAALDDMAGDNAPVTAPKPPPGSAAEILTSSDHEWSAPINLGPVVNSPNYDTGPALTADGLRLIVNTNPEGHRKLVEYRRHSRAEPFGEPRPLADAEAVASFQRCGITADGLTLLYAVLHPGRVMTIVQRRRPNLDAPWGPAADMEHPDAPPGFRDATWLSADGLTMLYSGAHEGSVNAQDIWRARRAALDTPFGPPENLGPGVNSVVLEQDPFLSSDGSALLFTRKMLSTWTTSEMFIGTADAQGRFHVRALDWPLKGLFATPWLSPDGRTLWFAWDGPGGQGGMDLWQIRRVPKKGKDPTTPYPLEAGKNMAAVGKQPAPQQTSLPSVSRFNSPVSKAAKEAPFVNSLGMKFVPVEVTLGPAAGRFVLYSVWETRVRDYGLFASETKRAWPKPAFPQGPDHPAVNLTWEDGVAFAAWLTARERKGGPLTPHESYRLPEDLEWSCAAGVGSLDYLGRPAADKVMEHRHVFPWGSAWPPPADGGNYAGEECLPEGPKVAGSPFKDVIEGYRDRFVQTAPAGSFAPNAMGLHDMGGNVQEWTLTWFDASHSSRTVRGGSWRLGSRFGAHSFARVGIPPAERHSHQGLRLVLVTAYGSHKEARDAAKSAPPPRP